MNLIRGFQPFFSLSLDLCAQQWLFLSFGSMDLWRRVLWTANVKTIWKLKFKNSMQTHLCWLWWCFQVDPDHRKHALHKTKIWHIHIYSTIILFLLLCIRRDVFFICDSVRACVFVQREYFDFEFKHLSQLLWKRSLEYTASRFGIKSTDLTKEPQLIAASFPRESEWKKNRFHKQPIWRNMQTKCHIQ